MFTNCAVRPSLIQTKLTKLCFVCASFADPENLINGNAMNASSRATALNIVADMLRKLNVSKPIHAQLEHPGHARLDRHLCILNLFDFNFRFPYFMFHLYSLVTCVLLFVQLSLRMFLVGQGVVMS